MGKWKEGVEFSFFFFRTEKKILHRDVKDGTFVSFIRESNISIPFPLTIIRNM